MCVHFYIDFGFCYKSTACSQTYILKKKNPKFQKIFNPTKLIFDI